MLTSSISTLGDWITRYGSIQDSRNFGGVVPAYPIFMFIGIIVTIACSMIKMKMKKIPLDDLYWAILIIVPIGILGGTIFGKVFLPQISIHNWWTVFYFWNPGMSLFGAVGLGTVAGFVWFYKRSKHTQISVWVYADCILPNVILGQAIGRWGNMFNQEILGHVVDYDSLKWIVPSIRNKLFYWNDAEAGLGNLSVTLPNNWAHFIQNNLNNNSLALEDLSQGNAAALGNLMWGGGHGAGWLDITQNGQVIYAPLQSDYQQIAQVLCNKLQFREPLFLYESIADACYWVILTFVIPNLGRWIQGPKKYPWDLKPNAYPGWYNPKVKTLPMDDIESWAVQRPIKYRKSKDGNYTISFWEAWNKAYYLYEPSEDIQDEFYQRQETRVADQEVILNDIKGLKDKHNSDLYRLNENFERKTKVFSKKDNRYIKLHNELLADIKVTDNKYKESKKVLTDKLGGWIRYFRPNPDAAKLEQLNNPNKYFVLRSGTLTGFYVLGYMIIRIVLETHRRASELFVQNHPIPDYIVLGIIIAGGLFIILMCQLISPYKYREVGWLYEKSY